MNPLSGKRVLLGVTGGIAAYKACELARMLVLAGAAVRVVMTRAATAFVTPLTFQALTGNPVHIGLLDVAEESAMGHIRLARWANLILVAPATADFMAKLRAGMADELLGAICLAAEVPVALAPAMNQAMWANPATQDNAACLALRGVCLLGPEAGAQACGEVGMGRMMAPADLCTAVAQLFSPKHLPSVRVLVSAGPTREPLDPVRYISNRSSGKMGYALAEAAIRAGAVVTLVSGPVCLSPPRGARAVNVGSAEDMCQAVLGLACAQDVYIGCAAVADYAPADVAREKIKKSGDDLHVRLKKTADILAAVSGMRENRPYTVGFAAETGNLEAYAKAKLAEKKLDMIAANLVGQAEGGFDSEQNALWVYWLGGERHLPLGGKSEVADQLIELIAENYRAKSPIKNLG